MKKLILSATAVCLVSLAGLYVVRHVKPASGTGPSAAAISEAPTEPAPTTPGPGSHAAPAPVVSSQPGEPGPGMVPASSQPATTSGAHSPLVAQAVANLASSSTTFAQKQAIWQQLKDTGKLDQAITHLEQQTASNPQAAEYPATLGQAYLQKAGSIHDVREQGILGMKADQNFEAALNADPGNWEARFWRATAMSYWPPQLNKSGEVIENYLELVKLQETQAAQPQFAQTYLLLGEQYEKQGQSEYAGQIWQRGAALFPDDTRLRDRLANPAPQVSTQARGQ